jgi:hypothetical protein
MIRFLALFVLWFIGLSGAVTADDTKPAQPVLVELFASQNCPACPKAHRTLRSVADENADVVVLTWSVDYWDYLGDADPMAMPEAKSRQAAYAERMNVRAPYTPQSVYDGVKQCPATRRGQVDKNIEGLRESRSSTGPRVVQSGAIISVQGGCETPLEVSLVTYLNDAAHDTGMVNPVTSIEKLGVCANEGATYVANCTAQCAVLLQEPNYGRVVSILVLN